MSSHDDSPTKLSRKERNPHAQLKSRGWVTLRDFCKIADITYPTALRWCRLKMINYIQVGGQKRIYEEELVRFLNFGTLPPDERLFNEEKTKREEYKTNAYKRKLGSYQGDD